MRGGIITCGASLIGSRRFFYGSGRSTIGRGSRSLLHWFVSTRFAFHGESRRMFGPICLFPQRFERRCAQRRSRASSTIVWLAAVAAGDPREQRHSRLECDCSSGRDYSGRFTLSFLEGAPQAAAFASSVATDSGAGGSIRRQQLSRVVYSMASWYAKEVTSPLLWARWSFRWFTRSRQRAITRGYS